MKIQISDSCHPLLKDIMNDFGKAYGAAITTVHNPMPSTEGDKLIRNYVRDSANFVECWEYEDARGKTYTICVDQDGGEFIEEEK